MWDLFIQCQTTEIFVLINCLPLGEVQWQGYDEERHCGLLCWDERRCWKVSYFVYFLNLMGEIKWGIIISISENSKPLWPSISTSRFNRPSSRFLRVQAWWTNIWAESTPSNTFPVFYFYFFTFFDAFFFFKKSKWWLSKRSRTTLTTLVRTPRSEPKNVFDKR